MKENRIYWQDAEGLQQLFADPDDTKHEAFREFNEPIPTKGTLEKAPSRRDFLKLMGYSMGAVSLAACEAPVRKAIPYLNKPEDIDPGVPNYYASTYMQESEYCSIVVKTREGRPIKIAGNERSSVSGGGITARVEASVLSLYDKERHANPLYKQQPVSWEVVDKAVGDILSSYPYQGKHLTLVSHSLVSPSTQKVIADIADKYKNITHVSYDPVSYAAALDANQKDFGLRAFPSYNFSRARRVVSVGADFLGNWLNPVLFAKQFAQSRKVALKKERMSRLYAIESVMSLSGANADERLPIRSSEALLALAHLYNGLAKKHNIASFTLPPFHGAPFINTMIEDLWKNRGSSLVLCGHNHYACQRITNAINTLLGAYHSLADWSKPCYIKQGDDKALGSFVEDLSARAVDGVIFYNCNPVYDHPQGLRIKRGLEDISFSLSTSPFRDETSASVQWVAPDHHYLEAWNDARPMQNEISLSQPAISPVFQTRQAQESLLLWSGLGESYLSYMKAHWETQLFAKDAAAQKKFGGHFESFWDDCLHEGVYRGMAEDKAVVTPAYLFDEVGALIEQEITQNIAATAHELIGYESIAMGSGAQANNPWLQELPDPITKACWGNYLTLPPSLADTLGIEVVDNVSSVVEVRIGKTSFRLPAVVSPGQAAGTVGLALGYGRSIAGKVGNGVGYNLYPLLPSIDYTRTYITGVSFHRTEERVKLPLMQTQNTYVGRKTVIQEASLADYLKDPHAGRYHPMVSKGGKPVKPRTVSLWEGHEYPNHHWGMTIDLTLCTGCNACVMACQVENNIPVVGKEEVVRRREMHWLRIDRYYASEGKGDSPAATGISKFKALTRVSYEHPEVVFQPMLCQHCNNAPCETVCPVAATTHSSEGLNQMTYNRCIGTRYCANNCPYKVRRFNWFKYHDNDQFAQNLSMSNDLGKMVLNPDVTVRSRGVMEKCSFCVQRIQAGKLAAKRAGRVLNDADAQSACAVACPTEAIVFGDLKNKESKVSRSLKLKEQGVVGEERAYHVLEELNVSPNVWYMSKIKNKNHRV